MASLKSRLHASVMSHAERMTQNSSLAVLNLKDHFRLLGIRDEDYNRERHRIAPWFEPEGDLAELVESKNGETPMLFAEPPPRFSPRFKLTPWEQRAVHNGWTVPTTVSEPVVADNTGIGAQLRMIENVALSDPLGKELGRVARELVQGVDDEDLVAQVLAMFMALAEAASKNSLYAGQVEALRGNLRAEQARIADLRLLTQQSQPTGTGNRRRAGTEEPEATPAQPPVH